MNDYLSWVIAIVALVAVYLLSEKKKIGWIAYLLAQIISMYLYYRLSLWGLFLVNIIFAYLSIRGYKKWKKSDNI
ncbi:MAG: nicotinamide mononucleotide transporter [Candidatus Paceibacterota bacterium]|jgi:chromate transport protein ChrA